MLSHWSVPKMGWTHRGISLLFRCPQEHVRAWFVGCSFCLAVCKYASLDTDQRLAFTLHIYSSGVRQQTAAISYELVSTAVFSQTSEVKTYSPTTQTLVFSIVGRSLFWSMFAFEEARNSKWTRRPVNCNGFLQRFKSSHCRLFAMGL